MAHIQGVGHGTSTAATTVAAAGSAVGAGNTVVGMVTWAAATNDLVSVKDNAIPQNTYTVLNTVLNNADNQSASSFILGNVQNGPTTLTASFGSNSDFAAIIWDEYSNQSTLADPSDGHTGQAQTTPGTGTNAISSGSITTTVNGDTLYGVTVNSTGTSGTWTAGTTSVSYTKRTFDSSSTFFAEQTEDGVQATAASGTVATFTQSGGTTDSYITFIVAIKPAGAAAPTFGWGKSSDADRPTSLARMPDTSAVQALPFFRPSQIPVPTVFWTPPISDREKLPPIKLSPDEPRLNTYFIRSPNPVPTTWLPTTGMEDRPPEPKKRPDDSSIENRRWFVRSPSPVPTSWLPLTGEEDRPPALKRPPDEPYNFIFKTLPVAPPSQWLPLTGEEDRPPHPNRILPPDQPFPFFVRSPNPVPARWLPTTGQEDRPPPPKLRPGDSEIEFAQWFQPSPNPVPNRWLPTTGEEDRPKRIDLDPSGSVFVRQPITAVGISGIAWYNPSEDKERPAPFRPTPINRFFSVQISTSTIAGMAWNNPAQDRERLPAIPRSPDEGTPFFVRSPNPVPIIWLPQWDGGEHPKRIDLDPSQVAFVRFPVAAAVPISGIAWYNPGEDIGERPPPVWPRPSNKFFSVQIPTTVPISGMAWYAPYADRERPPRAPPDASLTAFSFKTPTVVSTIAGIAWLNPPETRLPPVIGDPYAVQTLPFFIEPTLIPFYAAANADDFNPLKPLFSASDGSVYPFRFIAPAVGISGISWWRSVEVFVGPPPPTAEFGTQWRINQPAPPVGIAGISWWRQTEVYVGPPPPQLDYIASWNPQFIFTPTNLLLLRTLMGMGQ